MADLPAGAAEVAAELRWIAAQPATIEERASAICEPLRRLIPFEGYFVALLDPDRLKLVTLAVDGHTESTRTHLTGSEFYAEIELVGLASPRGPMCLRDSPVPASDLSTWAEHLTPQGFREALGLSLFTPGQRHLGVLTVFTSTEEHPTDQARDFVGTLGATITQAIDPMRTLTPLARMVGDASAGVVLTRGGIPLALAGLPDHPVLRAGSPLFAAVRDQLAGGQPYASFLWPDPAAEHPRHLRIATLAAPTEAPDHLAAIVLICATVDLRGLTSREVDVLSLVVDGWPNSRIAEKLHIATRTVAAHVEHIMTKLAAPTRTVAAVRALRLGLYVPHQHRHRQE
ncbi:LuxR C-terminal-related transcriptional regulator [Solwaraspora sp. WMMD1047]|uniref:helix-turn-helix transcriptional regulator n=1 Tax=Solwaraspora sp. WMMD1047 TaxID=3016102 RepID=UPI0024177C90|nr:LuxR C-terminal-related transcriptional regulator [Solwaraspora sp. WMMD1047]MDG4833518.1 LuxR C-terminal-related transcriptional regulator [Solwaraspora sp. WMMD1047]